jgi:hypothetical protein
MDSIDMPRRQFLSQSGVLVASAAVLNSPLLTQAFAAQPGEEIITWADQPPADPGVAIRLGRENLTQDQAYRFASDSKTANLQSGNIPIQHIFARNAES